MFHTIFQRGFLSIGRGRGRVTACPVPRRTFVFFVSRTKVVLPQRLDIFPVGPFADVQDKPKDLYGLKLAFDAATSLGWNFEVLAREHQTSLRISLREASQCRRQVDETTRVHSRTSIHFSRVGQRDIRSFGGFNLCKIVGVQPEKAVSFLCVKFQGVLGVGLLVSFGFGCENGGALGGCGLELQHRVFKIRDVC